MKKNIFEMTIIDDYLYLCKCVFSIRYILSILWNDVSSNLWKPKKKYFFFPFPFLIIRKAVKLMCLCANICVCLCVFVYWIYMKTKVKWSNESAKKNWNFSLVWFTFFLSYNYPSNNCEQKKSNNYFDFNHQWSEIKTSKVKSQQLKWKSLRRQNYFEIQTKHRNRYEKNDIKISILKNFWQKYPIQFVNHFSSINMIRRKSKSLVDLIKLNDDEH